jgi:mRNA-degrading endonuclease RelE of RelBE toxin-antitoxin system
MHKTYQLEISPAAKRDLKKLPNQVQKNIVFKHFPNIKKNLISVANR